MDYVIGLVLENEDGRDDCLLTWGRLYSPVDPEPILDVVRGKLSKFGLAESAGRRLRAAATLQEVAHAPMFYECLISMQNMRFRAILDNPSLRNDDKWYEYCRGQIERGRHIWYLGNPANYNL